MDKFKAFKLNFSGLKIGEHLFDFQLNKEFFDAFEHGYILDANLAVQLRLFKTENRMQLDFFYDGEVLVQCDRCLDDLSLPLSFEETLHIRFGEHTHEETDDVLVLSRDEQSIALETYLFEYAELHLPMRKVHADDENGLSGCNEQMLERMQPIEHESKEDEIDPRWAALKALKDKKN